MFWFDGRASTQQTHIPNTVYKLDVQSYRLYNKLIREFTENNTNYTFLFTNTGEYLPDKLMLESEDAIPFLLKYPYAKQIS